MGVPLAENWPSTGEIKFEGYATKYRPELPCVLENFNLDVLDNEKVGIVGRTGAGKSSLRFNLDPGNQFSDENLHRALHSAGLTDLVAELSGGLEHKVSEGGAGLSLGQRQLICLARALLRRSKVLVLDEATAAVDTATDERIQTTIRTEFASCTVLTIAHRLNTVTGGNTVLVLDKGKLVEQGSPESLLADTSSQFHGMAKAAGIFENHHLLDD